jgi:glycosyltransferase involved in cell wall biosynthesis
MSCLALPSHREGLGQVALEAAAAGLAVVASDTVGLRDAVVHGQTGLLVPPGNPEALAQALLALLADRPRAVALGQAGRARIERSFRPEALRAAWRDLYAELTT